MGLGLVITPQEEEVIMAVLRGEQVSGWTRMGLKMKMISNLGEIG
jgi:hypothetical protein